LSAGQQTKFCRFLNCVNIRCIQPNIHNSYPFYCVEVESISESKFKENLLLFKSQLNKVFIFYEDKKVSIHWVEMSLYALSLVFLIYSAGFSLRINCSVDFSLRLFAQVLTCACFRGF